jgi:glycosyltransferase involved in cell wall biosynthesis
MKPLQSVAFLGNHLPRRCGIATFTHDLHRAVSIAHTELETCVVAMTDPGATYDYPKAVRFQVRENEMGDYVRAAEFLNAARFDVVSLQHEFGIFGGEAGGNVVELLSRLDMPIVTTLHTILPEPAPAQRAVMRRIIDASAKIVVMGEMGRELLQSVHSVPARMIEVIPHGIPDFPFLEASSAKAKLGFGDRTVILTFGLLSPGKGIETVIDAMPEILKSCPNAVYVVLGASHPNLVRNQGEAYRESLTARARELGIAKHVVFIDQFVDQVTLLDFISMCDVYVTPYLNEAQMTSGTLAYSFGLGKAVVSTPYWHAKELLGDGRGILVPFGDANAIGSEIAALLANDVRRHAMRKRAYAASRSMTWTQTAKRYFSAFEAARQIAPPSSVVSVARSAGRHVGHVVPEMQIGHFLSMCDSTGMMQHAVHCVPDRSHGYCIDDNARALLFSNALGAPGEPRLPDKLTTGFAAFIQHGWNPETRRFRNFMSYDRRWLEDTGSEDSHGRTLWALAECARRDTNSSRQRWAAALFKTALPIVEDFTSPRAWAFTLLALDAYCALVAGDTACIRLRGLLARRLMLALSKAETDDWVWFEDMLAYDNARLPQALIVTGAATKDSSLVEAGLKSLRWLMALQTAPNGNFRPVGTDSFGIERQRPQAFDQQPVEAAATISACLAAWQVDDRPEWPDGATRAFDWFMGVNDLRIPMVERDTGSCLDGLHPDRPNENRGAESTLSFLLGLVEMRQYQRTVASDRKKPAIKLTRHNESSASAPRTNAGGHVVSIPLLEPSNIASSAGPRQGRGQTLQTRDRTQRPQSDG